MSIVMGRWNLSIFCTHFACSKTILRTDLMYCCNLVCWFIWLWTLSNLPTFISFYYSNNKPLRSISIRHLSGYFSLTSDLVIWLFSFMLTVVFDSYLDAPLPIVLAWLRIGTVVSVYMVVLGVASCISCVIITVWRRVWWMGSVWSPYGHF